MWLSLMRINDCLNWFDVRSLKEKESNPEFWHAWRALYYRIKHSFWRIYWCVNSGHFTHKLNKSAKRCLIRIIPIHSLYVYTVPNIWKASLHYIYIWTVPSKTANIIMKRHNETGWRNWRHFKERHHIFFLKIDCNNLLKIIKAYCYNILRG
jgi:hypothetical protein